MPRVDGNGKHNGHHNGKANGHGRVKPILKELPPPPADATRATAAPPAGWRIRRLADANVWYVECRNLIGRWNIVATCHSLGEAEQRLAREVERDKPLLEYHPLSELLPPMSEADYAALRADVLKRKKILRSGMLLDGKILDGRHRYRVHRETGVAIKWETFDPAEHGDPASYVLSQATGRHLANDQKPFVAVRFIDVFERAATDRMKAGGRKGSTDPMANLPQGGGGTSRDQAGEFFGCSGRQIQDAKFIFKHAPDLFELGFAGRSRGPDGKLRPGMNVNQAMSEYKRREKQKDLAARAAAARAAAPSTGARWELACGDVMKLVPGRQDVPRLIFVDPRYNMGFDYGLGEDADRTPEDDYLKWCGQWIELGAGRLADDGSFWVMIDAKHQFDVARLMRDAGLFWRNTIIMNEEFGSYTAHNFTPCARFIHYFTKSRSRHVWNGDDILVDSARKTEYGDGRRRESGRVPGNVWGEFPRLVGNADERMPGFPTQLPELLVERIVRVASDPGDVVWDFFNGTGTTGVAALRTGRRYFGCDIVERNVKWASHRLEVVAAESPAPPSPAARGVARAPRAGAGGIGT